MSARDALTVAAAQRAAALRSIWEPSVPRIVTMRVPVLDYVSHDPRAIRRLVALPMGACARDRGHGIDQSMH